ncbi:MULTISPECIES: ABC transporter ATP-binding protein [Dehalobacter]|jgi:putative ABC transport system ATP-binding protein|uniref:ATP-binding cassette domain-containing protein n=2 Tax=Dehalobacter restrictus TaxID=55583 RepID=A0A857DEY1_9FIRM|nr:MULTISPECIES: ABC transporter ATP-binding protein [Dehalobacter]AHF09288.1 multidrug ABC transporter ATP-binding protein [Dehalobacter restrictus DSM 9455]MCG1025262.1 ABC transporter ATP-binding protein [Dehalobacter sp.]MDJ0305853.1 ABC transporter ATP-binding protein [Dehalobacter sp.]OCZ52302.1 multidrug ABC transporter ATP-binding protein [Dehalobacter sp. TeCB1]QGZ99823.1 ATP-binding cassette domain-containing protein [Dehalobacter restrictus]
MGEILKVLNVEKYYGNKGSLTKALDNVSFSVSEGEFTGIMGASGSGKTTLLNCIATIDTVTAGNIRIRNKDITAMKSRALAKFRREELGFMFQEYNLLDTLTGFENIILPLTIAGEQHQTAIAKVTQVARRLEIEEIINKYPYEMSGGQRQRIAAARAIVNNPALILADEPTGALDSKSARMLMECLEKLNQDLRATILMVTHDAFTASYCHRILFIKDGKLFNELNRGADSRKEFFRKIIDVVTLLGGDAANVL